MSLKVHLGFRSDQLHNQRHGKELKKFAISHNRKKMTNCKRDSVYLSGDIIFNVMLLKRVKCSDERQLWKIVETYSDYIKEYKLIL